MGDGRARVLHLLGTGRPEASRPFPLQRNIKIRRGLFAKQSCQVWAWLWEFLQGESVNRGLHMAIRQRRA